jgi:hypothetical protein
VSTNLDAAISYAARGWRVFPLVPREKIPVTRNGFHDATTDQQVIARWWRIDPERNIGIVTGDPGPDVLDVEGNKKPGGSGWLIFGLLKDAGLLKGALAIIASPSEGIHLYFKGTGQAKGTLPGRHVDFQATGGYVVAPPSYVVTADYSGRYEILQSRDAKGTLNWTSVKSLLEPPRNVSRETRKMANTGNLAGWVAALPEGQRNNGLFWAACRAREEGGDAAALIDAAVTAGLPEGEALRTVRSATGRGQR